MSQIILLIIISALSVLLGVWLARTYAIQRVKSAIEKKRNKNLLKLLAYLEGKEKVTNNDVERLLGVSDATATRYLDVLEQEGMLEQVGIEGRSVHYKIH